MLGKFEGRGSGRPVLGAGRAGCEEAGDVDEQLVGREAGARASEDGQLVGEQPVDDLPVGPRDLMGGMLPVKPDVVPL
ncbi:hypothetical protein [Streptomyces sp. NPDC127092]|uniref:hypothetical protein n=1 Tax=Streptomyces sp. NPDC127092 TaxID=3347135 RepID=UPI00365A581B